MHVSAQGLSDPTHLLLAQASPVGDSLENSPVLLTAQLLALQGLCWVAVPSLFLLKEVTQRLLLHRLLSHPTRSPGPDDPSWQAAGE